MNIPDNFHIVISLLQKPLNNFESFFYLAVSVIVLIFTFCFCICFVLYIYKERYYFHIEREALRKKSLEVISPTFPVINTPINYWWHRASIYQIMIDRFNGSWIAPPNSEDRYIGGTLRGIMDKLEYIKSLGYDTVLLTPIFKSAAYHGYHTVSFDQIDSHFGTWIEFCHLVDAVHDKGMRIICDYVPNHCHISNPLFIEASSNPKSDKRDWFYFEDNSPYNYTCFLHYKELPKFNLTNDDASDYLIQVAEKLVHCGVDGLRIDHVIGLPFAFLKRLRIRLKRQKPEIFIFGEATATGIQEEEFGQLHFANAELRERFWKRQLSRDELQEQYVGVIDGIFDFEYRDIIINEIKQGHRLIGNTNLYNRLRAHFENYPSCFSLILFFDNPDTERLMYFIEKYAHGDKSMLTEAIAFTRLFSQPSCIYYGTEQYMTHSKPVIGGEPYADLQVRQPMDWRMNEKCFCRFCLWEWLKRKCGHCNRCMATDI